MPNAALLLKPEGSRNRAGAITPDFTGAPIPVPGSPGLAWQLAEPTTNVCINPSMETGITGWSQSGGGVTTITQTTEYATSGAYGLKAVTDGTVTTQGFYMSMIVAGVAGETWTCSFDIAGSGTITARIQERNSVSGLLTETPLGGVITLTPEGQRFEYTYTLSNVSTARQSLRFVTDSMQAATIYLDSVQIEKLAYATPFAMGSLGVGHSWSGTAHNSSSIRAGTTFSTPMANAGLDPLKGTLIGKIYNHAGGSSSAYLWHKGGSGSTGDPFYCYVSNSGLVVLHMGGNNLATPTGTIPRDAWSTIALTWDNGEAMVWVNGEPVEGMTYPNPPEFNGVLSLRPFATANSNVFHNGLVAYTEVLSQAAIKYRGETSVAWTWESAEGIKSALIPNVPPIIAGNRRGVVQVNAETYLVDKKGTIRDDISEYFYKGIVENNMNRPIKRRFMADLRNPAIILPYIDYIQPFLTLTYASGEEVRKPMGIFSIEPGAETIQRTYRTGSIDAGDLLWNLSQSTFATPYSVASTTTVEGAIRSILSNEGYGTANPLVGQWQMPFTTTYFPKGRTWPVDTSKLTIINDMCEFLGWYTVAVTAYGIFYFEPYKELNAASPDKFLFDGPGGEVVGAVRREPSNAVKANVVQVVKSGSTVAETISVVRENNNPQSPISIGNIGRRIFRKIEVQELASVAVAEAMALRALEEAASEYAAYTLQTFPDPSRESWEVYDCSIHMDDGSEALEGRVRVSGWRLGYQGNDLMMTHSCNRIEEV